MLSNLRWVKSEIPEGVSGDWEVKKFEVDQQGAAFHNLRCAINAHSRGREIESGTYTKLTRNGATIMSDTPAELYDFQYFVHIAKGNVLVTGLGLGLVVKALCEKEEVSSVVVIEKEVDVINLVYVTHLPYGKLVCLKADANVISPKEIVEKSRIKKFDFAWHDIFDGICSDNLEEMKALKTRFKGIVKSKSQYCWCEEECKRQR